MTRALLHAWIVALWLQTSVALADLPRVIWPGATTDDHSRFATLIDQPVYLHPAPPVTQALESAYAHHDLNAMVEIVFNTLRSRQDFLHAAEFGTRVGMAPERIVEALRSHHQLHPGEATVPITVLSPDSPDARTIHEALVLLSPLIRLRGIYGASSIQCMGRCAVYSAELLVLLRQVTAIDTQPTRNTVIHQSVTYGDVIVDPTAVQAIKHPSIQGILVTTHEDLARFVHAHPEAVLGSRYVSMDRYYEFDATRDPIDNAWSIATWETADYWGIATNSVFNTRISILSLLSGTDRQTVATLAARPSKAAAVQAVVAGLARAGHAQAAGEIAYVARYPAEQVIRLFAGAAAPVGIMNLCTDHGSRRLIAALHAAYQIIARRHTTLNETRFNSETAYRLTSILENLGISAVSRSDDAGTLSILTTDGYLISPIGSNALAVSWAPAERPAEAPATAPTRDWRRRVYCVLDKVRTALLR